MKLRLLMTIGCALACVSARAQTTSVPPDPKTILEAHTQLTAQHAQAEDLTAKIKALQDKLDLNADYIALKALQVEQRDQRLTVQRMQANTTRMERQDAHDKAEKAQQDAKDAARKKLAENPGAPVKN